MMLSEEDGAIAVSTARKAVEAECRGGVTDFPQGVIFSEPAGVFVTISEYPSGYLRGCIGYPEPVFPFGEALIRAAVSACHDPRFYPLTSVEAKECTVEVTRLTPPEELMFKDTADMLSQIELGRDGAILEAFGRRALFLPQVAPEQGWNKSEMFDALSRKAGLRTDAWKEPGVRVWTFRGEIFSETEPYGRAERR